MVGSTMAVQREDGIPRNLGNIKLYLGVKQKTTMEEAKR